MAVASPLCVGEEWNELAVEGKLEGGVWVPPLHTALQVVAGKRGCRGEEGLYKRKGNIGESERGL